MKKWRMLAPKLVLVDGRIYAVDVDDSIVEVGAVSGNRILATGTRAAIVSLAGLATRRSG